MHLGMMTPLEPGVTLEERQAELAKLEKTIADSLQRAGDNSDREIRRLARRATRVQPFVFPWSTCPPNVRTALPHLPVRVDGKLTKREAAACASARRLISDPVDRYQKVSLRQLGRPVSPLRMGIRPQECSGGAAPAQIRSVRGPESRGSFAKTLAPAVLA